MQTINTATQNAAPSTIATDPPRFWSATHALNAADDGARLDAIRAMIALALGPGMISERARSVLWKRFGAVVTR